MRDLEEAKKTIARYLIGERVTQDALKRACDLLNKEDPEAVHRLRMEMGLEIGESFECEVFRENAAEFCEMRKEERLHEMPDVVAHLESCGRCRRVFEEIGRERVWDVIKRTAKSVVKELVGAITLIVDGAANLWERQVNPAISLELEPVALAAHALGEPTELMEEPLLAGPRLLRKWRILDEDTGFCLDFTARGKVGLNVVVLECEVTDAEQRVFPAERAWVELVETTTKAVHASDWLSRFAESPLELVAGSWMLKVRCERQGRAIEWNVPFGVEPSRPGRVQPAGPA